MAMIVLPEGFIWRRRPTMNWSSILTQARVPDAYEGKGQKLAEYQHSSYLLPDWGSVWPAACRSSHHTYSSSPSPFSCNDGLYSEAVNQVRTEGAFVRKFSLAPRKIPSSKSKPNAKWRLTNGIIPLNFEWVYSHMSRRPDNEFSPGWSGSLLNQGIKLDNHCTQEPYLILIPINSPWLQQLQAFHIP